MRALVPFLRPFRCLALQSLSRLVTLYVCDILNLIYCGKCHAEPSALTPDGGLIVTRHTAYKFNAAPARFFHFAPQDTNIKPTILIPPSTKQDTTFLVTIYFRNVF